MKSALNIIILLLTVHTLIANDSYKNVPHCTLIADVVVSRTGCDTLNNQIVITPSGGVAPYEYSLNGINWVTDSIFDSLTIGPRPIYVRDSDTVGHCVVTQSIYIPGPLELYSVDVDSTCYDSTGRIQINVGEGQQNYKYSIDGGSILFPNKNIFENLGPGTYPIVVEDAVGCQVNTSVSIGLYPAISSITIDTTNITCNSGLLAGIVGITIAGNDFYDISIDGGFNYSYEQDLRDSTLQPGYYGVVIKDQYGCTYYDDFNIEKQQIADSLRLTNEFCNGSDGSIELFGYLGISPYEYSIDGGATFGSTNLFSNLTNGIYNTQVRDSIGCISYDTVRITNFGGLVVTLQADDTLCRGNSTNIAALHNGGLNVTYSWNNGLMNLGSHVVSPTASTTYITTVTDQFGCQDSDTAFMFVEDQPSITVNPTNILACLGDTVTINASGARAYSWFNGDTGATINAVITGNSNLTVEGYNGFCVDDKVITVQLRPMPTVFASSNKTNANTGEYINFYSSGSTSSGYLWDFGDGFTSQVSNPLKFYTNPGTYTVKLTGFMGQCTQTDSLTVVISGLPIGVDENALASLIQFYPNPSNGAFTIETSKNINLEVINIEGKVLYNEVLTEGANFMNYSLNTGVYVLRFSDGESFFNSRLVINK